MMRSRLQMADLPPWKHASETHQARHAAGKCLITQMARLHCPAVLQRSTHRRPGTIVVFAMMALLIVSMIGASLGRTIITSMRQLQREQHRIQADWLANAGCQRAVLRIQTEPNYEGEEWVIPDEHLQNRSKGVVRITVVADDKTERRGNITVVAEFPQDSPQKVRISRQISALSALQSAARLQRVADPIALNRDNDQMQMGLAR